MDTAPSSQFISQHLNIAPSKTGVSTTSSILETEAHKMASANTATPEDKKRLTACLVCRKRKLKCDSARPKCGSCARLGHAW